MAVALEVRNELAVLLMSNNIDIVLGCGLMIPSTPLIFYLKNIQLSGRIGVWEEEMCLLDTKFDTWDVVVHFTLS